MIVFQNQVDHHVPPERKLAGGIVVHTSETDERRQKISEGLFRADGITQAFVNNRGLEACNKALPRIHSDKYLQYLQKRSQELNVSDVSYDEDFIAPNVVAETALNGGIWNTAVSSATVAAQAALALCDHHTQYAYAVCRPPGHHAGRAFFGGYCYINNAALASQILKENGLGPVGIIDIDYHFGNGTFDIVQDDQSVSFGSVHCSTNLTFPFYPDPSVIEARHKFVPFSSIPSPSDYINAIQSLLNNVLNAGSRSAVLSVGFDVIAGDPHGKWDLQPSLFEAVGRLISSSALPVCIVQEGGYRLDCLSECAFHLANGISKKSVSHF